MKNITRIPAILISGAVAASLGGGIPAQAVEAEGQAVIVCEAAVQYDPEVYDKPGFICEIDPAPVILNGEIRPVLRYGLQIRKNNQKILRTPFVEYGIDPAPVFVSSEKLQYGESYNVDYLALLDDGTEAEVNDDDFTIDVPKAPGRLMVKARYGTLKKGIGRGYTVTWAKTARTDGYQAQVKKGKKWRMLEVIGNGRRVEYGRTSRSTTKFRVRAWNAGGPAGWKSITVK